ncbi:hypothetical protein PPYR_14418 [Photinus pyralis]|uniref:ubiquitinyl hydrolase 1 n=1 Tax=Photinus pyralis TaxID=7054 RepID=A0A5N4A5C0_PHOPY|nr:ubiquitin carboxyl-terminal hydrolase 10 isoform X2 [Photinus pyralis]KAB0792459.1 hypothetical protein PPYR_14418 [Photinus pyralis]
MDQVEASSVEFLDLSGIEEQERAGIITSLHSSNPKIKLPWSKTSQVYTCDESTTYGEYANGEPQTNHDSSTVRQQHTNGVASASYVAIDEVVPTAKSWASLFNKGGSLADKFSVRDPMPSIVVPQKSDVKLKNVAKISLKEPFKSHFDDPNLIRMGEFLSSFAADSRIISLQPRGLINRSNYCYINSILQAILACPPVYNLLVGLSESTSPSTEKKRITPTIDSMTKFVREFNHLPAGMRVGRRLDKNQKKEHSILINCDTPFEPFWFHKLLSGVRSDTFVVEGRQEDAEEFLCCLLNSLNDEMLELMKLVDSSSLDTPSIDSSFSSDEDKEWQVMGPKNKGAITRRTEFSRTPISDIFGGSLRSRLHRSGDQSTDNIQPFFTLQLNIEKTNTVREALDMLVCKNQLEGVTSSKTNEEVEAWQQVTLEELPLVLVLHLKCFDYKLDGCSKIMKALEFPIDLKIESKMLSLKSNYTPKEKQYKLFAIVYHEGKEATKGHYVTDAYHVGYASWLRYDDASVKAIPEEHVLNPLGTRVPYLLFYRRSDSLNKNK